MPHADSFSPALQQLLLSMLNPKAARRPTATEVLASAWVAEPSPGLVRPLCVCWRVHNSHHHCLHQRLPFAASSSAAAAQCSEAMDPMELDYEAEAARSLASAVGGSGILRPRATNSDLRLLRRRMPALRALSLAYSPCVNDEWLEVLATHHAGTLTHLDLSGCVNVSSSSRPLLLLTQLPHIEAIRLPAERWRENELADALTALPRLRAVDRHTYADLARERDALRVQCEILGHVRKE